VRDDEPDAVGIFAFGSYAQGTAERTSDLDLQVVTLAAPRVRYRTWFVGEIHVSVGAKSTDELRRLRSVPAGWSLGFAVEGPAVWVWSTGAAVAVLGDPPGFSHPPGEAELEDFVEWCAKALRASDPVALRVAAYGVGETAPVLLRDLSAPRTVRNRVEAVHAALELDPAPDGWRDDLAVLLALVPADDARVREAVERLAPGVLALLRERAPGVDPQPDIGGYLADGTLERHLGFA
jgi:Nucleotidyltransferase domain